MLRYLARSETTTQGELAEHIAAVENDVDRSEVTSTQRKRVYISLYQSHLPKLEEAGAIDFDENRGTVERVPGTADYWEYLNRIDSPKENPTRSAAAVNVGCSAALVGAALIGGFAEIGTGMARLALVGVVVLVSVTWIAFQLRRR